jgi:hypothetical protein
MTGLVAGVDVGCTFPDLVIFDPASGALRLAKVPTTLPNQSGGVLAAFEAAGALPNRGSSLDRGREDRPSFCECPASIRREAWDGKVLGTLS